MKKIKLLFVAACCSTFGSIFAQVPENLYIIGGTFNGNKNDTEFVAEWRKADALLLENAGDGVFYYRGYIGSNLTKGGEPFGPLYNQFKFVINGDDNGIWDGYHPKGANQEVGAAQVGTTFEMTTDGTGDLQWYVAADGSSDGYYVLRIDTKAMTFKVESYTKAETEFTVGLFLIGGPFIEGDLDWSERVDAVRMERDASNPDVFHYRGIMEYNLYGSEPGNFKILVNGRTWEDELHPAGDANVSMLDLVNEPSGLARRISYNGPDNKWFLPEDGSGNGYWDFTVDAKNMTFTVNEFVPLLDYLTEIFLTGEPFGGFIEDNPEVMQKTDRGIFQWTGKVAAGRFKFLRQRKFWAPSYMATVENDPVTLGTAKPVKYVKNYTVPESGNDWLFVINENDANKEVTITLDLEKMEMSVEEKTSTPTDVKQAETNLTKIYASAGHIILSGITSENYHTNIFSIDGKCVYQGTFTGKTEIALPQGCYIVSLAGKTGYTLNTKVVL